MTSGQRQGPALEIVQTRDISAADRRDLTRLWQKRVSRKSAGRVYTAVSTLWYAFAAFLSMSILMTVRVLKDIEPNLALQLVVAALGFAIFLVGTYWFFTRQIRDRYWTLLQAGDRYALESDGLRWSTPRGTFSCGLASVETIVNDSGRLIALLPHDTGLFMVKAAFEGQDVEAFGAELVRRWQAHRVRPGAPA